MLRGLFERVSGVWGIITSAVKRGLGIGQISETLQKAELPVPPTPLSEVVSEVERGITAREGYYALNPWDYIPENMFTYAPVSFKEPYVYRFALDYTTPEGYRVAGKWVQIESVDRLSRLELEMSLQDMLSSEWYTEEIVEYEITDYEFLTRFEE